MSPADRVLLQHIADAIDSAQRFARSRCRADLDTDEMLLFALVRATSVDARARMPGVPWRSVVGMRNRLVHAYFDVDRDILWSTVAFALPPLLAQVRAVLDTEADAKGR